MPDLVVVEKPEVQTPDEAAASFSAGYNKVNPPAEAAVAVVEEVKPAVTVDKPADKEPDPWEGVPPVVRKTLDGITGKLGVIDKISHEVRIGTGRIAAIQSELDAAKAAANKVPIAPTDAQITAAAASPEKWDKLKELFKDWSEEMDIQGIDDRITQRLAAERAEILKQMPKSVDLDGIKREVDTTLNTRINKTRGEVSNEVRQLVQIDSKHPTWEQDIYAYDSSGNVIYAPNGNKQFSADFAAWNQAQPPEVKALADSDKAQDAIKMLDLFYDHRRTSEHKQQKDARLASAVVPKQAASGGPTILPDEAGLSVGYNRMKHA